MMNKEILDLLIEAIEEQSLFLDEPVDLSKGSDTALYTQDGQLDSLSLITIIADVEKQISSQFGFKLKLANERDLGMEKSPFSTLGAMHAFILDKLQAELKVDAQVA
ncbi:hypothetical protein DFP78_109177 [Photobacterium lutimaris]|nr:hypothetical protein [Photobacterium lutimaris]TDR74118.1 hypothetical protein DFP78_109177 [Photobacterium lutimaris]